MTIDNLKQIENNKSIVYSELALLFKISESSVRNKLTGRTQFTLSELMLLCEYLHVDMNTLVFVLYRLINK